MDDLIQEARERRRALDPSRSFIVQAPAGSGKTELLIQRYLRLLAEVGSPEAIVAITFTKKSAGEMRARVIQALEMAATGVRPEAAHRALTFDLATAALARDSQAGWRLAHNPARMRIQTIDSLSASITSRMPWLARFGAPPEIVEKAADLYREAARNTLRMVAEEERSGTHGPLSVLLLHLDNNFSNAARLIAGMLEKRDQWLRRTGVGADLTEVRKALEQTLARWIARDLAALRESIPADAVRDIVRLLDLDEMPADLGDWVRLADIVLTNAGKPRKKLLKEYPKEWSQRLIASLSRDEAVIERLDDVRKLPDPRFEDSQWEALQAFIDVMPRAVAELQLVFRERGRVDFTELSIRAGEALGHAGSFTGSFADDAPTDLALTMGQRIEHLLVDEFQDTSFTQFALLGKLTAGWAPGDGHSLFLVGDPMQSIYRFREADVSLFLKARREGIGNVVLEPLTLRVNFRSDPSIVAWVNETFTAVLPKQEDIHRGAVAYSASVAHRPQTESLGPVIHAFLGDAQGAEAEAVAGIVEQPGTTAILVRARSHLTAVIKALHERGIPFQAIEIDQLGERPIIQDLMALTFALLHLADRISWLAILRAPWCGLSIADLHAICAAGDPQSTIWELLRRKDLALSADGAQRLARCLPVFNGALENRGRVTLRALVEQTWLRLGGPACVTSDADPDDTAAYLDVLEGLEEGGDLASFESLRDQVAELFAQPSSQADGALQIMTIHKAKGLEFDTVILPGLGQPSRKEDDKLLIWQEQDGELLLAAMSATGEDPDPIYRYLARMERERIRYENARLLYVAATRARNRLHLLGCARVKETGDERVAPESGSFLKLLWPAVGSYFQVAAPARTFESGACVARTIRRLPADWKLPAAPPAVVWKHETLEPVEAEEIAYEWVGDTARHVGTVLHRFFERIAAQGLEDWESARVAANRPVIRSMLSNLGVPPVELDEAAVRVEKALLRTIQDERGRWVLARHAEAVSEYAVTGLLDGKVYPAKIDRTFVDDQGVRWIIDFKTSSHEGGSLENFLESEKERHRFQLERYARLIAQRDERPIRLGLYFPMLNEWLEWGAPTIKRRQASLFD